MNTTSASPIISAEAVIAVPLRLALGVLARQPPGHALEALQRRADEPRERPHEHRREQRDAEDHHDHAEAEQRGRGRAAGAAEQADEQRQQAERR